MTPPDSRSRLDRHRPEPLWRQLQQDLVRRIGAGEFEAGFPAEADLREAYGVSRHTVREALRGLREAGLLDSHRGRTTRVRPGAIEQPLGGLYSLFAHVEAQGLEQRSVVRVSEMRRDPEAARALGRPESEQLFHLERVRFAGGEPLAYDRTWLPAAVGEPLLDADFSRAALYDEVARAHGVRPSGGRERIAVTAAGHLEHELLEVEVGSACFSIDRATWLDDGRPLEWRLTVVRGDRYAFVTTWDAGGYHVSTGDR